MVEIKWTSIMRTVIIKLLDKSDRLYKNKNKKKLWLVYCICFNSCNGIQTFMILITLVK